MGTTERFGHARGSTSQMTRRAQRAGGVTKIRRPATTTSPAIVAAKAANALPQEKLKFLVNQHLGKRNPNIVLPKAAAATELPNAEQLDLPTGRILQPALPNKKQHTNYPNT